MQVVWRRDLGSVKQYVKRYEELIALVTLGLLAFAIHKSALNGFWRFDDGAHLEFAALYSPWQYFLQPSVMLLQSYAHITPYNVLFYEINLALFGMEPRWHYAHQIIILALTAFSTYRFLRFWQGPLASLLASMLFLGGLPTLFVAQQLMTGHYATGLLFTVLSLHSFVLGVQRNHRGFVWLGAVLYLLATTCKEVYVPLVLLLLAIPIGELKTRLKAALPYAAIAIVYTLWRYAVLGQLIGGYVGTPSDSWEQWFQMLSIPLLMLGWLREYGITNYFLGQGRLYFVAAIVTLLLIAVTAYRKRLAWTLIAVSLPIILLPLLPLTKNPGIHLADRYLFVAWWACSVLLGTLVGNLRPTGVERVLKGACAVGLVALFFTLQAGVHRRISPWLGVEDTLYQTVMHMDTRNALIPPPNRDYYKTVLSGARHAASLIVKGADVTAAKFVIDKSSLCEYAKKGHTILEFDATCNCMKDVTHQITASLTRLLDQEVNSIPGVPLMVKLALRNSTLSWELGPYTDGVYTVIFGSSPNKVPAKGSIPWAKSELMQFKIRHVSPDGRVAISPSLDFDMTQQSEFSWQGSSLVETFSCAPD